MSKHRNHSAGETSPSGGITIGKTHFSDGRKIPWVIIYPFFMVHMLAFGFSGFVLAYSGKGPPFAFALMHGGIAIFVYLLFYLSIFGRDEVKWMLINGALGLFGIWSQIDWILSKFGKDIASFPPWRHIMPFLYYILYTFLLRQAFLDLFRARQIESRRKAVEAFYVVGSIVFYVWMYFREH